MAEQKVNGKEKLRLNLCDCHHVQSKHQIEISRSKLNVKSLIDIAKKEMGLQKTIKIYRENGVELLSSNMYRVNNNDTLYASDGRTLDVPFDSLSISVLGPGAVGKSGITLRFIQDKFVPNYDPTIEDAYRKSLIVDGNALTLNVLDTAGQDDFKCLRTMWVREKDGFVLVFSIVSRTTFNELQEFYETIVEVYEDEGEIPPIILVGNKVDLDENHVAYMKPERKENDLNLNGKQNGKQNANELVRYRRTDYDENGRSMDRLERRVSVKEAMQFAKKINAFCYIETSAKSGYNVEHMFGKIVRHLINQRFIDEQKSRKKTTDVGDQKWWSKCQIL